MLTIATAKTLPSLFLSSFRPTTSLLSSSSSFSFPARRPFSSATRYPLYYELIAYRPARRPPGRRRDPATASSSLQPQPAEDGGDGEDEEGEKPMLPDKSKRKYYRKRTKRMYGGSDSDSDGRSRGDEFVELHPEIVDFPRLHAREEELYFYDAFAFPWEKEKHYRMVYQLEKKYFPDQCLDKAFADPGQEPVAVAAEEGVEGEKKRRSGGRSPGGGGDGRDGEKRDERGLIFFEEEDGEAGKKKKSVAANGNVSEKKVEEFFKNLKKVPGAGDGGRAISNPGEPILVSRKTGLPPRWDGPSGTAVLVDKPKGQSSQLDSSIFFYYPDLMGL